MTDFATKVLKLPVLNSSCKPREGLLAAISPYGIWLAMIEGPARQKFTETSQIFTISIAPAAT